MLFVTYLLQLAAPRPQSRVTFSGAQIRNCSVGSGSSRSSTSGSCCSRWSDAGHSFKAGQVRHPSLSEAEDFQVTCFARGHSDDKSTCNLDRDVSRRPKKAKVVRDIGDWQESPFVQSVGKQNRSFASLEQSLGVGETDSDECHFWSKISSPQYEDSFVRLSADEDMESPLTWAEDDDRSTRWSSSWQTSPNNAKSSRGVRPVDDHFQRPGDVRLQKNVNLFGPASTPSSQVVNKERISAVGSHSAVPQKNLATDTHAADNDAGDRRHVAGGDSAARCDKWWAFVHGVTSELSTPGRLLLYLLFLPLPLVCKRSLGWINYDNYVYITQPFFAEQIINA